MRLIPASSWRARAAGLRTAETIKLPGKLTAMVTGEINRPDGLVDLVAAVDGPDGPVVLVFEGPRGALRQEPEVLAMPADVTDLALARLEGHAAVDLVIGAGHHLQIVPGRDRRLSLSAAQRDQVGPPLVKKIEFDATIRAVAAGQFTSASDGLEVAVLLEGGSLQRLGREVSRRSVSFDWKVKDERQVLAATAASVELQPARLSGSVTDEIVILDATHRRIVVVQEGTVVRSENLQSTPRAVLPMQLDHDALTDLVLLDERGNVSTFASATLAAITVTTAADSATADDGFCSLREAILNANGDTDTTGGECAAPPCVELDGSAAGLAVNGLTITGGGSTVRGLAIHDFDGDGISLGSNGNLVEGNRIGTDRTGTIAAGNNGAGVFVAGADNDIGGAGAGNLLSGNGNLGIYILKPNSTGNQVRANLVGTDVTGTGAMGNGTSGVRISGGARNNTVGGTLAGAGNTISGNLSNGVLIADDTTSDNKVIGNRIGTDLTGTVALGNQTRGVRTENAVSNVIGGTIPEERNVISANGSFGVSVFSGNSTAVLGNRIGTDAGGMAALGNGLSGVLVQQSSNTTIGGTTADSANLIAGNTDEGIVILGTPANRNPMLGNLVFANGLVGIDRNWPDGVTPNDLTEPHTGPNALQNYPTLSLAEAAPAGLAVSGSLNSRPNIQYRLEFYGSRSCDGSGYGEGANYLGFSTVTTDGSGDASFTVPTLAGVSSGDAITATATSVIFAQLRDTSEFSACVQASCLSIAAFGQSTNAPDRASLAWMTPDHV